MNTLYNDTLKLIIEYINFNDIYKFKQLNSRFNMLIHDKIIINKYVCHNRLYTVHCIHEFRRLFGIVLRNFENILYLSSICKNTNIFDIMALNGRNDMLTLLKKEFPEIKGTSNAFDFAVSNNHIDTLMLLKKEFPEIRCTETAFDVAASNGHNDILMLLKDEFPEIKGTSNAFDWAARDGHSNTLMLLKKQFPHIKGTRKSFDHAAREGHNDILNAHMMFLIWLQSMDKMKR